MQLTIDAPPADLAALQDLVRSFENPRVIEVGSWVGTSAIAMAVAGAEVHCIDTWKGSPTDVTGHLAREYGSDNLLRLFCKNAGDLLFERIFPHIGTSAFWGSQWPWKADLVFLDAEHSYGSVRQDIELWTPHVRDGGILCGHDLGVGFPDVERAVSETGTFERLGETIWFRTIQPTSAQSDPPPPVIAVT